MKTYNLGLFGVAPRVAKPFPSASYGGSRGTTPTANSYIADPGISATVPITSGVTGSKVIPEGFVDGGGDPYLNQVFDLQQHWHRQYL